MSKTIDKQKMIDHLDGQANYFYDNKMVGVSGMFVILRDEIEEGKFDSEVKGDTEAHDKVRAMYDSWINLDHEPVFSPETVANIIADVALIVGIDIPGIDPDDPENQFIGDLREE